MSYRTLRYLRPDTPGVVELPLSKSIASRVLVINALCAVPAYVAEWPDSDDCLRLREATDTLREALSQRGEGDTACLRVNLGSGAAPFRFFTALVSALPGVEVEIDVSPQLAVRPVAPLLEALRAIGADITCVGRDGYAPLLVRGRELRGGEVEAGAGVSSQFVSALMMIGPLCREGVSIKTGSGAVSLPYIEMTAQVMRLYGVSPSIGEGCVRVAAGRYKAPARLAVEPDWSAASYAYGLALLTAPDPVRVRSLTQPLHSAQGDSACAAIYRLLGVEGGWDPDGSVTLRGDRSRIEALRRSGTVVELDMRGVPDLVPALAVSLCGAGVPFRFTGVGHLRHKECDRLAALSEELSRMGWMVESGPDSLRWSGRRCPVADSEPVRVYGDHRMAMAMSLLACRLPWVSVSDPEVVAKSFPGFWDQMESAGLVTTEISS